MTVTGSGVSQESCEVRVCRREYNLWTASALHLAHALESRAVRGNGKSVRTNLSLDEGDEDMNTGDLGRVLSRVLGSDAHTGCAIAPGETGAGLWLGDRHGMTHPDPATSQLEAITQRMAQPQQDTNGDARSATHSRDRQRGGW
ncbi:hypothetical protein FRC12_012094 [Ceratobasidium sp. 428]|nr:hypothetical protein FRC12_012094 [Ceratobasidium sp. 428]